MKRILVVCETIFSDRLASTLGLKDFHKLKVDVMHSSEINDLQNQYLKEIQSNILYRSKFKLVKFIRLIHRYVAPHGIPNQSLMDHLEIDSINWSNSKKKTIKLIIEIYERFKLVRQLSIFILKMIMPRINKDMQNKLCIYDGVFFFSLGNLKPFYVAPLHNFCKKKKIKTFCYIQSWDNPSTKGYALYYPDIILTWTNLMQQELEDYMDFTINRTYSIGSPLFIEDKLDINRNQHILFATKSPKTFPHNAFISEIIAKEAEKLNVRFTVRVHPLAVSQNFIDESKEILNLSKKYGFDVLLPNENKKDNLLNADYDALANEAFKKCTLFISVFSTMNLESINLGINTINIDFQDENKTDISPRMNIIYDRRQVHNIRALSYGCISNARTPGELVSLINNNIMSKNDDKIIRKKNFIYKECRPIFRKSVLEELINTNI